MTIDNGNGKKKLIIDDFQIEKIMNAVTGAMSEERRAELDKKSRDIVDRIVEEATSGMFQALQDVMSRPEYKDLTQEQLFARNEKGKRIYDQVKQEARELFAERNKDAPKANNKKPEDEVFPIDKVNNNLWRKVTEAAIKNAADQKAPLTFDVDLGSDKKGAAAAALVSVDFDDFEKHGITLSKNLNSYDKRVMLAYNAVYQTSENGYFTLRQIYNAMGNVGTAGKRDLKKIDDSLTKMGYGHITINNERESKVFKSKPHFEYDAAILPFERITAVVNGQLVDGAIHAFREPPLITFAKQRKQVTTIPIKVLQSPINKTDDNLRIEDYLLERIARAKSGNAPNRILFDTLFEECDIEKAESVKRSRAKKKVVEYLTYYKECAHISDFTADKKGVTITL